MTNTSITYLVAALSGVFSLAAYVAWIAVPAWKSYSRGWERVAAVALTFYVLAAMVGAGLGLGAVVVYYYDHFF
jgi:hypothetical protein